VARETLAVKPGSAGQQHNTVSEIEAR
jgi:hypothetical protein